MNQELGFETIPFEIAPEFQGELFEEEGELGGRRSFAGGGSRYSRPRSGSGRRSRGATRRPTPRPRPRPRGPWAVVREPYSFVSEPYPGQPEPSGSERVRWVQDCLNQAMGLQLPVTGVMGPETRSAVRSFQKQQGLRVSGIVGPDTEAALKTACAGQRQADGRGASEPDSNQNSELSYLTTSVGLEDKFSNEELQISVPYEVTLMGGGPVPIPNSTALERLPTQRGIYFIHVRGSLWYIGKADNIRARFQDRFKAFDDFKIPRETYLPWLQQVRVSWYLLGIKGSEMARGIKSRLRRSNADWKPVTAKRKALLRAVEQYFISKSEPTPPPGNRATECVRFEGTGAIKLVFSDGRTATMNTPVFC